MFKLFKNLKPYVLFIIIGVSFVAAQGILELQLPDMLKQIINEGLSLSEDGAPVIDTAAVHAAMTKNDVRAAISWVGVIILSPILGPFIYLIAGINRVRHSQISEQRDKTYKQFASKSKNSDL